jgi:dephospho-CoA kinase
MNILLFTGLSASGKSTISRKLSERQRIPRLDIHQIIHELAEGYDRGREWIAEIGETEALHITNQELFQQTKKQTELGISTIIIDEVINMEMVESLSRLGAPHIIHVKANRHDRIHFMRQRLDTKNSSVAKDELRYIDSRKETMGIREVIENRQVVVVNTGHVDSVCALLEEELCSRGILERENNSIERR